MQPPYQQPQYPNTFPGRYPRSLEPTQAVYKSDPNETTEQTYGVYIWSKAEWKQYRKGTLPALHVGELEGTCSMSHALIFQAQPAVRWDTSDGAEGCYVTD